MACPSILVGEDDTETQCILPDKRHYDVHSDGHIRWTDKQEKK